MGMSLLKSWQWSIILLAVSLAITLACWSIGLPFFFVFLFIPLIPLLKKDRVVKRCPVCGWETTGRAAFCPYDGNRLETGDP